MFSMLVGEEEGDVVMEDKIEVTVHVIGISPLSNCRQFTLIPVIYFPHVIYMRSSVTKIGYSNGHSLF